MESNICLFHIHEKRTMAFCGPVKQERWNRLLRPIDDMSRVAISRALGEGVFNYEYTWRTNSDIIGLWVGCLARAGIDKWDIIRITYNTFDPSWLLGLEEVVANIDEKLRIPLPEAYMEMEEASKVPASNPRRPCLVIRDNPHFFREWPRMEVSINFLLRWRGIIDDPNQEWLRNYLKVYGAYIEPNTNFKNLEKLEFSLPNYDKSGKGKTAIIFPPGVRTNTPNEIAEIIMVYQKSVEHSI